MNYDGLIAALDGESGYLHRDDLTDTIPTFVELAQARITHDIEDHPLLDVRANLSVTAGTEIVSLPDDCRDILSIRVPKSSGYMELEEHTLAAGGVQQEASQGAVRLPKYYTRIGMQLELSPTPESDLTCPIVYQSRLTTLAAGETDNFLTWFPNLYVYAVMLEAQPWLVNDKRIATFGKVYENEVTRVTEIGKKMRWSRSPKRVKHLGHDTP